ncbi:uncharacterized protein FOMMEDRAFT_23539 [Fomitiporia mediterranea MF3/22]|uniref:uncharacterized protein n=1 Tax=Fomitiporia mediterranea (strain MF3/22) TaxID=694068 RepID=UPI0004409BFF|nr:uncharacterized protein FOMMEDRAFT_23539 [Fomitiporia mediterranea MF3/22]EJC98730.1 hypothetical protein FOMMEDRAFT_23539 [Fomitiporia mediterranea MF3/22]
MSGPSTPFIPPHPSELPSGSPAASARVIPPTPGTNPYVFPPGGGGHPPPPGGGMGLGGWGGFGYPAGYQQQRGRRNSRAGYEGMPSMPGGGPPFDHGTYFGYPAAAAAATPAMVHPGLDPRWGAAGGGGADYLSPEGYAAAQFGQPPAVIPPRPSPSRSRERSRSRGGGGGFSADWAGPRSPEEAGFGGTWYTPAAPPGWGIGAHGPAPTTGFSTFTQELPQAGYYPYGHPAYGLGHGYRGHHRRGTSAHTTPWMGGGFDLPPETPGEFNEPLDPYDRHPPAARPQSGFGTIDTRWFTGASYGPVLDPLLASVVKCSFKINPLLLPPPEDPTKRPYLTWNMLFSTSYVHRSDERQNQSWLKGRDAPATHPRLTSLRLISRHFTWFIEVKARNKNVGVTCGELVEKLSSFLLEMIRKDDFESLSRTDQGRVTESYYYNRERHEDVPGGRLGNGMRRVDLLLDKTTWGGMEVDQRYVKERMSLLGVNDDEDGAGRRRRREREVVGIFLLNCERRLPMTEDERRAEAERASE